LWKTQALFSPIRSAVQTYYKSQIPILKIDVMRLLLKTVCDFAGIIWLDTRWSLLRLFGAFHKYYSTPDEWDLGTGYIRVMPRYQLILFGDFRGTIVWHYKFMSEGQGAPIILGFRGCKDQPNRFNLETCTKIQDAHDQMFIDELEKELE
jgi:hypothetical protein